MKNTIRRQKRSKRKAPSREEINKAFNEYIAGGGKITKLEVEQRDLDIYTANFSDNETTDSWLMT